MWETWVWSLGGEDSLEKEMATLSSILAWKIPWTEECGGPQSTVSRRVGHDWATSASLMAQNISIANNTTQTLLTLCSLPSSFMVLVYRFLKVFISKWNDSSKNLYLVFKIESSWCSLPFSLHILLHLKQWLYVGITWSPLKHSSHKITWLKSCTTQTIRIMFCLMLITNHSAQFLNIHTLRVYNKLKFCLEIQCSILCHGYGNDHK